MGKRSRQLILFFLTALLLFLGLESYPYLQKQLPQAAGVRLHGVFPRRLPANQSHLLQVFYDGPVQSRLHVTFQSNATETSLDLKPIHAHLWQALIPPLAPGEYLAHVSTDSPEQATYTQGPFRVQVGGEPTAFVSSVQRVYYPGQALHLLAQVPPGASDPLFLNIKGPNSLQIPVKANVFGAFHWEQKLTAEWPSGTYSFQLSQHNRPVGQRAYFALMTAEDRMPLKQKLSVVFSQHHLIQNEKNKLPVEVSSVQGLPLEKGWIRLQGQTFSIEDGKGYFEVTPDATEGQISYHVGDQSGLIEQGVFWYQATPKGLTLVPFFERFDPKTQESEWSLQGAGATPVMYAFGQGDQFYQRGEIQASEKWRLQIPENAPLDRPFWIALTSLSETPQSYLFQWELPGRTYQEKAPFRLSDNTPHALQDVQVRFPPGQAPAFFEVTQSVLSALPYVALPTPQVFPFYTLHSPPQKVAAYPVVWKSLYALVFILLALWPLVSLLKRPFKRTPAFLGWGIWAMGGLSLLNIAVVLLGGPPRVMLGIWAFQFLVALVLCLPQCHPQLLGWRSLVMGLCLYFGVIFWALSIYLPAVLPASMVASALAWLLVLYRFKKAAFEVFFQSGLTLAALAAILFWGGRQVSVSVAPEIPFFHVVMDKGQADRQILDHKSAVVSSQNPTLTLEALPLKGPRFLEWRLLDQAGQWQYGEQMLKVDPAVMSSFELPLFALQGDILSLPLVFDNEVPAPQSLYYRVNNARYRALQVPAAEKTYQPYPFAFKQEGLNTVTLDTVYKGVKSSTRKKIYIKPRALPQEHPDLDLQIRVPQEKHWKVGAEMPLRVQFSHRRPETLAFGIQIGIPTGYTVYPETLKDPHHSKWIQDFKVVPGYLNITTKPLVPTQAWRFHLRMKVGVEGVVHLPASSIFELDNPKEKEVVVLPQGLNSLSK